MKKFFLLSFLIISFNLHTAELDEKASLQSESYRKLIEDHPEFKALLADANIAPDKVTSYREIRSLSGPVVQFVYFLNNKQEKTSRVFLKNENTGIFYAPNLD